MVGAPGAHRAKNGGEVVGDALTKGLTEGIGIPALPPFGGHVPLHIQTGRGEGRAGGVVFRIGEGGLQCAVTAHGGAHDIAVLGGGRHPEHIPDNFGQVLSQIGEVLLPIVHIGVVAALGIGQHKEHVVGAAPVGQHGIVDEVVRPTLQTVEQVAHLAGRLLGEVVGCHKADGGLHIQRGRVDISL